MSECAKTDDLGCFALVLLAIWACLLFVVCARIHRAEDRLDKLESRAAWFCAPEGQTHEAEVGR